MKAKPYGMLALNLGISFLVMYSVMFLNVADVAHIRLSVTRSYMALLMVAPMAVLMMALRWRNFPSLKANLACLAAAAAIFAMALIGLRTQTPIGDVQYMKAMIPHHSSAILTSRNAKIVDPEVRELADDIIEAQLREIRVMEGMLERLER